MRPELVRPALFGELFVGSGAVSVALQGGAETAPPISWWGSKAGYARPILWAMGLRPGQGAERFLWAEADRDARLYLEAMARGEALEEALATLRLWEVEEPRALWDRLRAEERPPPLLAAPPTGEGVARWLTLRFLSYGQKGGSSFRAWAGGGWPKDRPPELGTMIQKLERLRFGWPTVEIIADARAWRATALPEGSFFYLDPPYLDRASPYAGAISREELLLLALRLHELGATVAISEAEPLTEALPGWHAVDLGATREGQGRSRGTPEHLTINRPPAWTPWAQEALALPDLEAGAVSSAPEPVAMAQQQE